VVLLVSSIALATWNYVVRSPLDQPSSRPAAAAEVNSPHALVHPYSANTFLAHEVEEWRREKTMEMIELADIGWIKQQFLWSQIEPSPGSHWDAEYQQDAWQKYDEIVDLAERHGVRVIARLDHTPPWARPEGSDYHTPPSNVEDYGRFVGAFVERYSGRVQYIQIWNEPNLSREWGGDIDPDGYFELLRSAYEHAKAADPDVVVLSAPMAMTNERSDRAMPELDYWERLYELGAHHYFDVLTATGFGINDPPEREPHGDDINLRRIERLREIMDRNEDFKTAVWLTEYGWNAPPLSVPDEDLLWGRASIEEQAEWTARGIEWMSENWDWFGVSSIWYFRQTGVIPPNAPEYYFAMVDLEFTPRPVYLAVKDSAGRSRVALPGKYGPLESPVQAYGVWSRFDDPNSHFGQSIVATDGGSEIRVRFSGTDLTLLTSPTRDPRGRLYVEINGEPYAKNGFLVDDDGNRYVDLSQVEVTESIEVVKGFETDRPQGEHEVTIRLGSDSRLAVSGIEVAYHRSYGHFLLFSAVAGIGVVFSGLLLRR
jgi:polysaccharide biosynthesis protein PslG